MRRATQERTNRLSIAVPQQQVLCFGRMFRIYSRNLMGMVALQSRIRQIERTDASAVASRRASLTTDLEASTKHMPKKIETMSSNHAQHTTVAEAAQGGSPESLGTSASSSSLLLPPVNIGFRSRYAHIASNRFHGPLTEEQSGWQGVATMNRSGSKTCVRNQQDWVAYMPGAFDEVGLRIAGFGELP